MSTPEGATLKSCMAYLSICGIAAWRINTMGTPLANAPGKFRPAPSRGIADIIGIVTVRGDGLQALPFACEVKSAQGRQSPAQREFELRWEHAGGLYLLVRSVEELREALRDAGVRVK